MQNVKRHTYIMRDFAHYFKHTKVKKPAKQKVHILPKIVAMNIQETTYGVVHG